MITYNRHQVAASINELRDRARKTGDIVDNAVMTRAADLMTALIDDVIRLRNHGPGVSK